MRENVIPFVEHLRKQDVTISWDIYVAKLAGLVRWRAIVIVESMRYPDGTTVKGDLLKLFVQLKFASFYSLFDARQGLVYSTYLQASQFEAEPLRAVRDDYSNQVSVFFTATSNRDVGAGIYRGASMVDPDPNFPWRAIATEDIWRPRVPPLKPSYYPGTETQ